MIARKRTGILTLLSLGAAFALAACGGGEMEETTQETAGSAGGAPAEDQHSGQATSQGSGKGPLRITAAPDGSLDFEQDSVEAKAEGGAVELVFSNPSDVVHDVVVERDGKKVGATKRVTDGEASTKLKLSPGEYTFYCSVTGHQLAGMEGTLEVR